jgi:hypothetical protein
MPAYKTSYAISTKCWAIMKQYVHKIGVVEMRLLRKKSGNTRKDRRNEEICLKIGMASIDDNMRESCLRWFGHVQRGTIDALVKKSDLIQVKGPKKGT